MRLGDLEGASGGEIGADGQSAGVVQGSGTARDGRLVALMMATRIHIDYKQLTQGLVTGLLSDDGNTSEAFALLLYSLLQLHPTFTESAASTGL